MEAEEDEYGAHQMEELKTIIRVVVHETVITV
jgi:hypothetical protein